MKRALAILIAALLLLCACAQTPTPAPEPTQEPPPTPTPLPTPAPVLLYMETGTLLPDASEGDYHLLGTDMDLNFSVYSNYPITNLSVVLTCSRSGNEIYPFGAETVLAADTGDATYYVTENGSYPYRYTSEDLLAAYTVLHETEPEETIPPLDSGTPPVEGNEGNPPATLNELLDLSLLQTGVHRLTISACAGGEWRELFDGNFYVLSDTWELIKKADFDGGYQNALDFFGDPERFCYRYQWVEGRYIVADPLWEQEYIVSLTFFTERAWIVHVDGVPYYNEAMEYLQNGYVRVSGTNGDSGVLPLTALVLTYNGSYVSRFNSQLTMISAHAFGAASDVNASLIPNSNVRENKKLIADEVNNCLVYNGIKEEDGQSYYDFAYSGAYEATALSIPDSIINYLLYELAFYRAGFQWGHYYNGTSDAMHFCLPSEKVTFSHDGEGGLRKVFEYGEFVPAVKDGG
ncbi:MAG: M15 family metallopeptidase [Clostridiales bacterium]|nr:M15 family metallopeptidase [Clostridiales bacterium]